VHACRNLDCGTGSAAAIVGGIIILLVGMALYRVLDRVVRVSR